MSTDAEVSTSTLLKIPLGSSPDKTAIVFDNREYSYEKINVEAEILASRFESAGLRGEPVAFMLPNGFEIVITYLACFKSGAVAMPLNRRYAPPELFRCLENSKAKWLIMETDRLDLLENLDLGKTSVERVIALGIQESTEYPSFRGLLEDPLPFTTPGHKPEDPAVIFYTSGSTGEPKGVTHTHSSVIGVLESTADALSGVTPGDVILVQEPQCHISGFIATFTVLTKGGSVIVEDGFDPDSYITAILERRPSLIVTHIDIIMKLLDSGRCTRDTFSTLRGMYTGGDELPAALQKRYIDLTGEPIRLGYGMTEAIWLTVARRAVLDRPGYIGKPVKGVKLRIADSKGKELPVEESGEIWVKGGMVMSRYWNNSEATREAFSDGWFRTGDCGVRDAHDEYYYSGRIKNIIIRNTSNITPSEVENALYKHPGVKEAAVIGMPDEKEGHVPVAFVVPKAGAKITEKELRDFAGNGIAEYKIPARVFFIGSMPLTSSGKIDHKALYEYLPGESGTKSNK